MKVLVTTGYTKKRVVPADAGIQRLESLGSGYKHAGMTRKRDSSEEEYL